MHHKHGPPPEGHHEHDHDNNEGWGPRRGRRKRWRKHRKHRHEGKAMFSVKRPLRFLIHKLELEDDQIIEVADALSDFKIEKDQADVERRRAKKVLVSALKGDEFDHDVAAEGVQQQVEAHERLRKAFVDSLERVHAVLNPAQREKLAFLLGSLDIDI